MSKLNLDTLAVRDDSEEVPVSTVINGSAKAWVNFDGTLAAASMIQAAFNVSSITDGGAGIYTINFDTALVDADYCVASHARAQGVVVIASEANPSAGGRLTTSFRTSVVNLSSSTTDAEVCNYSFFR